MHDPTDPIGRLLFKVLAMVAEFESDLIRLRTREGMKVAKAKNRLRGKQPKLNPRQEVHLVALHRAGEHSAAELGDLFGVTRSTVYRAIERDGRRSSGPGCPVAQERDAGAEPLVLDETKARDLRRVGEQPLAASEHN